MAQPIAEVPRIRPLRMALVMLGAAGLTLLVPGFLPVLPAWAVVFGVVSSCVTGIAAGYLPARQAAAMDPVEALRHE